MVDRLNYQAYTDKLTYLNKISTNATVQDIKSVIYTDGAVHMFKEKIIIENKETKCQYISIENISASQNYSASEENILFAHCDAKCCTGFDSCKLQTVYPSTNIIKKKTKCKETKNELKEKYHIISANYDIRVDESNMQHVTCPKQKYKMGPIILYGRKIVIPSDSTNSCPKVMVHYLNNKYETIFALTQQCFITESVVCYFIIDLIRNR